MVQVVFRDGMYGLSDISDSITKCFQDLYSTFICSVSTTELLAPQSGSFLLVASVANIGLLVSGPVSYDVRSSGTKVMPVSIGPGKRWFD